jgi:hypothetical protein
MGCGKSLPSNSIQGSSSVHKTYGLGGFSGRVSTLSSCIQALCLEQHGIMIDEYSPRSNSDLFVMQPKEGLLINFSASILWTSWKPVLRTDFSWTCWGLNRIEHHFEAIYPHIPVFTIVNPSPESFLTNLLPHSITHNIEHLSSTFVLPRCNNCRPVPYLPKYRPSPTKNDSIRHSVINEI